MDINNIPLGYTSFNINALEAGKSKKMSKEEYRALVEEDRQEVVGRFKYNEQPGGLLVFQPYIHEGDPLDRVFRMRDGEVYRIPYGVAKKLNECGEYAIRRSAMRTYKDMPQVNTGDPERMKIVETRQRYSFHPIGFNEKLLKAAPKSIATVTEMNEYADWQTFDVHKEKERRTIENSDAAYVKGRVARKKVEDKQSESGEKEITEIIS